MATEQAVGDLPIPQPQVSVSVAVSFLAFGEARLRASYCLAPNPESAERVEPGHWTRSADTTAVSFDVPGNPPLLTITY